MENQIICPNCGEKNPPWYLYCFKCDRRLKESIADSNDKFPRRESAPPKPRKTGTLPNETFENVSVVVCVVLLALVFPVFLLLDHVYEWKIFLWFAGFCLYYRALYEVYSRYVVRDEADSIWLLILGGLITGLFGGVIIATLWDIIRLGLRMVLRPMEPLSVHFFWSTAIRDTAIN